MDAVNWTVGFEIELVAPPNLSRRDLAHEFGRDQGAAVRAIFYPQAEISAVTNKPVFETLTLGWEARNPDGRLLGRFVDDLTLQDDLDRNSPPKPGWFRILSDDPRLMRLVGRHCTAEASIETVLEPVRQLFDGGITVNEHGFHKLVDRGGDPIAIAAPLPGERERACEIISAPVEADHAQRLEALLTPARRLGFRLPAEGAVHIHFDATRLATSATMGRLVRLFHAERDRLRTRFRPNPHCRRLGPWSAELLALVEEPGFDDLSWNEARMRLAATGLTKFCDFNIVNIVDMDAEKFTFEVRIVPPSLDCVEIIGAAAYFSALLQEIAA